MLKSQPKVRERAAFIEAEQNPANQSFLNDLVQEFRAFSIQFASQKQIHLTTDEPNLSLAENKEAVRLIEIVLKAVDLLAQENGECPAEISRFSLRQLVEVVFEIYVAKVRQRPVELQLDFSPSFPGKVMGDRATLVQIIVLLIDNAVRFTSEGSISLTCFYQESTLIMNISDTGEEIPDREQTAVSALKPGDGPVFNQSFQRKGLLIASRMIRSLAGNLSVRSEHRLGSIVTVQIPLQMSECPHQFLADKEMLIAQVIASFRGNQKYGTVIARSLDYMQEDLILVRSGLKQQQWEEVRYRLHGMKGFPAGFGLKGIYHKIKCLEEMAAEGNVKNDDLSYCLDELSEVLTAMSESLSDLVAGDLQPVAEQKVPDHIPKKVKILVAEDNRMNQEMIAYLLKASNFEFRIVENGRDVINALQDEPFDLLLLDMQMPVMDGVETIKNIRTDARWKALPVIAVTAQNLDGDDLKYKQAGCDEFVAKPIDINELTEKINNLLDFSPWSTSDAGLQI